MRIRNVLAVVAILIPIVISAQSNVKWRGSDGWGVGDQYDQLFKTYSTQSINGKITKVDTVTPFQGMTYGVYIMVKSDREEIPVHLGPAWFIIHQDMNLTMNDIVDVKGTRTAVNGKQCVIASEIKRKDRVLRLRDQDGIPAWCVWRKK